MRMLTKDLDQFEKLSDKPQLLYSVCRSGKEKNPCEHKQKEFFNSTSAWMVRYESDYLAHIYD